MSNLISAVFNKDYDAVNKYLDDKLNTIIHEHIDMQEETVYTLSDLDTKVNEDETLREYLEDGIETFKLSVNISELTDETLNDLIKEIDRLWAEEFK